jgi:hypothetical protein
MKETLSRDWLYLLAFVVFGLIAFAVLHHMAVIFFPPERAYTNPTTYRALQFRESQIDHPLSKKEKISLSINQQVVFGKAGLTYRGLEKGAKFKIDVVIFDFDPKTAYTCAFNIFDAKNGFRLVNRNFKLISAQKKTIRLWHISDHN